MNTQSDYEIWNKEGSGVLSESPLILNACKDGKKPRVYSENRVCGLLLRFKYGIMQKIAKKAILNE